MRLVFDFEEIENPGAWPGRFEDDDVALHEDLGHLRGDHILVCIHHANQPALLGKIYKIQIVFKVFYAGPFFLVFHDITARDNLIYRSFKLVEAMTTQRNAYGRPMRNFFSWD